MNNFLVTILILCFILYLFTNKEHFGQPSYNEQPVCNRKKKYNICTPTPSPPDETKCVVPQSSDEFNDEFFEFRDKVYHSSSMQMDPVDRLHYEYYDGDLSKSNNKRIQDIYDDLVKSENLYSTDCVRLTAFDETNPDGYFNTVGTPGMSLVRDSWKYKDENIMNGGNISKYIKPNDPDYCGSMNVRAYDIGSQ